MEKEKMKEYLNLNEMQEIDEIERIKEFDHIEHSGKDSAWLQKKWIFICTILASNIGLVAAVIFSPGSAYIMIPFITLSHIRDWIYVLISIFAKLFRKEKRNWGKRVQLPSPKNQNKCDNYDLETAEFSSQLSMASVVTCYTEKYETVLETVMSLFESANESKQQIGIEVQNIIVCVCDGQLVGEENSEPLGNLFLKKMTQTQPHMVKTYRTWKQDVSVALIHIGYIKDEKNVFILVRKLKNHGKKDGLILAKKIISSFGTKYDVPYLGEMKYVFCTDADTSIELDCIPRCVKQMEQFPELDAGVCLLRVKFHSPSFFWDHMQHFQYFSSQYVRRSTESFWGKVSCLSGAGNILRISSKPYQYANYHYQDYPRSTSIMDVVPKMIGTDRRYTTLMLKASDKSKMGMFPKAHVYTETPQDLLTYISQRKRWGSNSFSNSLVNMASRNIPWYLKLSALIDVFRILSTYFRIVSYIWFWVYVQQISISIIIFVAVTVGVVYLYSFLYIMIYGDKRLSLLYGFVLNKITTPLFGALIFSEIIFRFDDFRWGMTQKVKDEDVVHNVIAELENMIVDDTKVDGEYDKEDMLKEVGKRHYHLEEFLSSVATPRENQMSPRSIRRKRVGTIDTIPEVVVSAISQDVPRDVPREEEVVEVAEVAGVDSSFAPPAPAPPNWEESKPKKKTKTFHWKPIRSGKIGSTFWGESESEGGGWYAINEAEMEKLFAVMPETNTAVDLQQESKMFLLVDFKKAHRAGIVLSGILSNALSLSDLMRMILHLDSKLSVDQLKSLCSLFPLDKRELENLSTISTDVDRSKLLLPDQFFLKTLEIPHIKERMECKIFKRTIKRNMRIVRNHFSTLRKACVELKTNEKFGAVLKIIFKLGSVLNRNSYLGDDVKGFHLDALLKLNDTRSIDGNTTFLDYVIKTIMDQKVDLLDFVEEFKYIHKASKITTKALKDEFGDIVIGLKLLKKEIIYARSNETPDQKIFRRFLQMFNSFYEKVDRKVEVERVIMDKALKEFNQTVSFYGEDPRKIGPDSFFGIVDDFVKCVGQTRDRITETHPTNKQNVLMPAESNASLLFTST